MANFLANAHPQVNEYMRELVDKHAQGAMHMYSFEQRKITVLGPESGVHIHPVFYFALERICWKKHWVAHACCEHPVFVRGVLRKTFSPTLIMFLPVGFCDRVSPAS